MTRFAVILLVIGVACAQNPTLRLLGSTAITRAGFTNMFFHEDATDPLERYSIIVSTFNAIPLVRDPTYFVKHLGKYLDDFSLAPVSDVNRRFIWPREPSQTPNDVFGFETITQPTGFLVPTKNDGTINIVDFRDYDNPITYDIIDDPEMWFYHRALWKDCNGDGRKDALTLRARVDLETGVTTTQMLWLEHPESDVFAGPWQSHILNTDVVGMMLDETKLTLNGKEYDVLIATGYFTNRLVLFWSENGLWNDPSQIGSRVLDVGGQFFDVHFADLNNDGNTDILCPINAEVNGTLVAYEIPQDFKFGQYKKHLLADGFDASSGVGGAGAPGQGFDFYPSPSVTGKPWIYLSGDDEGTAYYYIPNSQSADDWTYEEVKFFDAGEGNIVGKISAADVNGDGYMDLFVPAYQRGELLAFTFAP